MESCSLFSGTRLLIRRDCEGSEQARRERRRRRGEIGTAPLKGKTKMKKTNGKRLPQGGTSCSAAGESATSPMEASCPSYSGGGNPCLPLASGNKSRGGSQSEASFEDQINFNFNTPDKVSGERSTQVPSKLWRKGSLERQGDAGSDSDSASGVSSASPGRVGVEATAEKTKFFRKRPRTEDDRGSSSNGETASARKISTSRRGKGREGSRGRGLASQGVAQRVEKLAEEGCHLGATSRRGNLSAFSASEPDTGGGPNQERKARFEQVVEAAVRNVALKRSQTSKNKAISAAAASILAAAEANFRGPPSDEMSKLREEVARLAAATELLQKENEKLRADLAGLRGAGSKEVSQGGRKHGQSPSVAGENQVLTQVLNLVRQELAPIRERFSVLEGIVLRPPLAASQTASDQKKSASYAAAVATNSGPTSQAHRGAGPVPAKLASAKQQKGGAAAQAARAKAPAGQQATPPSNSPTAESGWQVVGDKKKAGKAARAAKKRQRRRQRKARSVAAKLRAPKTAAVVITLQPDAEKRGVTYGHVLVKAKEAVNLQELGITGGLRLRLTMTGARMLEIPGSASGPTADALAERLRASLNADEVRVSRPTKCVDVRILGLDDSVTEEEVVAAVVRTGGCSAEQVKAGTIRPDNTGMRTVVVSCPVTAAKKISEGRRLLVGWVSAQVKLLEPRPLRCFRCQVGNHVGVQCTSEVDRSDLCFRCGQPGHKAGSCNATPHCVACAAAGKPADHWAGGKACAPPAKAGGKKKPSTTAVPTAAATVVAAAATTTAVTAAAAASVAAREPSQGTQEEAEMECQ